jgi:hypothetical protein
MKECGMRKPFALVLPAVALVVTGCGSETCPTRTADVTKVGACGGPLAANTQVTIDVTLCATCSDTSPSCTGEVLTQAANQIFLDAQFQECQSNASCPAGQPTSCAPVHCTVSTPGPGGPFQIVTANSDGSTHPWGSVDIAGVGNTRCTL